MRCIAAAALSALAILVMPSAGHSWIEQMMVVDSKGVFTGTPGYARNNTLRTVPGFSDVIMVHILPGDGQPAIEERDVDTLNIKKTDPMCKKTQQEQIQSSGSPRLSAAPGSMIALRYQENGHVTLPMNQPGKPPNRGTVYIYGTTQPKPDEIFLDIFKVWNVQGTGGDKRGKLLATQSYDDGRCYQTNSGAISQARQKQYPHTADQLMGTSLWCQNDITIPADAPSGKPYTLYWVWDWPTEPNVDPNLPKGKAEIYTTCMDVDIIAGSKPRRFKEARALQAQDLNSAAIPSYMSSLNNPAASAAPAAPPAQKPAAPGATAPKAAPQAAATESSDSMTPSKAAVIFESAMASEVASWESRLQAAPTGGAVATVTVTQPAKVTTVYVTGQAPAATSAKLITSSLSTTTIKSGSTISVASSSAAVIPQASLNIQAPAMSPSSVAGTSSAVATSPAMATSSAVATTSGLRRFAGTASPASVPTTSAMASVAPRSCPKKGCRAVKRSKILAHAAHRH